MTRAAENLFRQPDPQPRNPLPLWWWIAAAVVATFVIVNLIRG